MAKILRKLNTRRIYKSDEEYHFSCWLYELQLLGYIDTFTYEPFTLLLSNKASLSLKREGIPITRESSYTPDFLINWNQNSLGRFTYLEGGDFKNKPPIFFTSCNSSLVEIKGDYDRRGTSRDTLTKIRWVYCKYNLIVQVVKPSKLFKNTFYPESFLWTPKGKPKCKIIKGEKIPLRHHIKTVEDYYDRYN